MGSYGVERFCVYVQRETSESAEARDGTKADLVKAKINSIDEPC